MPSSAAASACPRIAPARQAKRINAPVFIACRVAISFSVKERFCSEAAFGGEIELSVRPPFRPGRTRGQARDTSATRTFASAWTSSGAMTSKARRQQRVADENGGRFIERLVDRRPPAAQIVIVHGRQVIMDQRIAVHEFQGRAWPSVHRRVRRQTPRLSSTSRKGRKRLPPSSAE